MPPRKLHVWLDDKRPAPEGWHHCRHVWEVIALLKRNEVGALSLDFDLGPGEKTGLHLVMYMCDRGKWPGGFIHIHSQNPYGSEAMKHLLRLYAPPHCGWY